MAALDPLSEITVFPPTRTRVMATAFDAAWHELQAMGHVCAAPYRAAATREKLAARILELARQGEDDVSILKDYALGYFLWSVSPASISPRGMMQACPSGRAKHGRERVSENGVMEFERPGTRKPPKHQRPTFAT